MVDIANLIMDSDYNSFKNNEVYTGSFTISGTTTDGLNTKTYAIFLNDVPDMTDIVFSAPADSSFDPRPNDAWFKQGLVLVLGNEPPTYIDEPTDWLLTTSINGNVLTVTAYYSQQFSATLTLTPVTVYYRVIDYSVF